MLISSLISSWWAICIFTTMLVGSYAIYQRFFHPLACFPGPFWASLTDFWKVYQLWSMEWPLRVRNAHEQYGSVVRVGPKDLFFTHPDALQEIYKSGRSMPKGTFYNAFTAVKPNLFGMQDEELHSIRRRQVSHGFSTASVVRMEEHFDHALIELREKLDTHAESGQPVDLKQLISYNMYDVLGKVAFSLSFNTQRDGIPSALPAVNDHIFLSCLFGSVPGLLPWSLRVAKRLPIQWLQKLFESRANLREAAVGSTRKRMEAFNQMGDSKAKDDLITHLINTQDPTTGAPLEFDDIAAEAFAMIVAGSHTTSGSITLLFAHLLLHPECLTRLQDELDGQLPLSNGVVSYTGLEAKLPYATACIRENFRITPVFTMSLPRVVSTPGGTEIGGVHVPQGTNVAINNYAFHHEPSMWGADHDCFDPARWLKAEDSTRHMLNNWMPFGAGHRACIGRNIAMVNIYKTLATLLRNYDLRLAEPGLELKIRSVGIDEMDGPLMVYVRARTE